jgi:chaperonin GroES
MKDQKETKIRVLGDRVLVTADSKEKMTKSGIHIPDTVEDAPVTGVVVQAGTRAVDVKTGDSILFGRGAGAEIEVHKQKYVIMREADIVAIM